MVTPSSFTIRKGEIVMPDIRSLLFGDREEEWPRKRETENIIIGYGYKKFSKPPIIGKNPLIRSNTVIYNDVTIGDNLRTGHNVLIREKTTIGDDVLIGTNTVIEGHSQDR